MDKYGVKMKLHRDPTSEKSDLFEFKMDLFDNINPEDFLLFVQNFQMYLGASGVLTACSKTYYLSMHVNLTLFMLNWEVQPQNI